MLDAPQIRRLVKFGVVGFSGVFVNLIVSELFFRVLLDGVGEAGLRLFVSNGFGIIVSIFTNFLLNDRWTWGDRAKGGRSAWFRRLFKYYLAAGAAGLLQAAVSWASFEFLFVPLGLEIAGYSLDSTLSICTGIGAGMVINFLASHFWAFKDEEEEKA